MSQFVPSTTAIRRRSVRRVPTDRLMRRHQVLLEFVVRDGGRSLPTRHMFAMRAAEFTLVEDELERRGAFSRQVLQQMRRHAQAMAPL